MKKSQIIATVAGSALAIGALTGGTMGAVWLFTPPTHSAISISQSHQISDSKIQDTQLAASTARNSSQWTIQQEAAAKKAAEEAAAAALAAQQAAEAQAAADAAAQAQAADEQQSYAATDSDSSDTGGASESTASGEPSGTPLPMQQVTDPNNGQYGQMVPTVDPASWCASGSGTTRGGQPQCT